MTQAALYDERDVDQTVRQFRAVRYGEMTEVAPGVHAIFHDAGHILGSAIIELRVTDGDATTTVVFSGDLGRSNTPIVADPTPLTHADFVLAESTYGNREHADHEAAVEQLAATINEVAGSRGVMLVPSFAIGRTQELVWVLDELLRDGRIPHVPLYLDSPMASRASDVYLRHPEVYDEETATLLRSGDSPLAYPGEQYTNAVDQSKAIRDQPRPIMVVASSGMLTGGRVMHHLKDFLPDPACTLLFIGYQAEGTLGRHLQTGGKTARIDHAEYDGALQGRLDLRLLGACRRQRADGLAGALRRISHRSRSLRYRCPSGTAEARLPGPWRPRCHRALRRAPAARARPGRPRPELPRDGAARMMWTGRGQPGHVAANFVDKWVGGSAPGP